MLKILFLADTHIGFDDPQRKRIVRRRRGNEFWRNYLLALDPAFSGEVDLVIHGGDLLYRSKVPSGLVSKSFAPLIRIADKGIPVFVVPGNHERGYFNRTLFDFHPNLFIFNQPRSFHLIVKGMSVLLAGFPFIRENIRQQFINVVEETKWQDFSADIRLLCFHQNVDGASVGPVNFTFRKRPDTIDIDQIPGKFDAVLTGHIHRHQIIQKNLAGNSIPVPVIYPGSTERTSFAEMDEDKGFIVLNFDQNGGTGSQLLKTDFHKLKSRPMLQFSIDIGTWNSERFTDWLKKLIQSIPVDSLVRLQITGAVDRSVQNVLRIRNLRALCHPEMNIYLHYSQEN